MNSLDHTLTLDSPDTSYQGVDTMADEKPQYISTKEAAKILKVGSTQAVRYLMEQYPDKLPAVNVGSEAQPRWVLRREDVERFQYERDDKL